VPVEVVAAWTPLARRIEGVTIAPGECDIVLNTTLNEAIIGFGTLDDNGRWVSLQATSVPDLGTHEYNFVQAIINGGHLTIDILTPDSHNLCVGPKETSYQTLSLNFQDPSECAANDLVPLTTSFRFVPNLSSCSGGAYPGAPIDCYGGEYALSFAANPATGEITVAAGRDAEVPISSAVATTPAVTRSLFGRPVKAGTDRRWLLDDGSLAFKSAGETMPNAFFDVPPRDEPLKVAPADLQRLMTLTTEIAELLAPANVRFNGLSWGDYGRLCFDSGGVISCAYDGALDFGDTQVDGGDVHFFCRGRMECVVMARPWVESDGYGKVTLSGLDMELYGTGTQLMVFRLASHQDAEALAAKVRERGEIIVKYAGPR